MATTHIATHACTIPSARELACSGLRRTERRRWFAGVLVLFFVASGGVGESFPGFHCSATAQQPIEKTDAAREQDAPESWEISRIYEPAWLRYHFMRRERLPKPISVPSIRGNIVDADGVAVEGADIVSHTPRHWAKLFKSETEPAGELKPSAREPFTTSKKDGKYGLPKRTEPYRVLVVHKSGVASISHEDLIRAKGRIQLQKWARVEGKLELDGKPQSNERIRLYINTLPWSYSTGGPRVTAEYETRTDDQGRYRFDGVPPLPGRVHKLSSQGRLDRGARYVAQAGMTTEVNLGEGIEVRGALEPIEIDGEIDSANAHVTIAHDIAPPPYPEEIKDDAKAVQEWRREWYKTAEGQEYSDEHQQLANMNYFCTLAKDGSFRVSGIPPGRYKVVVSTNRDIFSDPKNNRSYQQLQFTISKERQKPYFLGVVELNP